MTQNKLTKRKLHSLNLSSYYEKSEDISLRNLLPEKNLVMDGEEFFKKYEIGRNLGHGAFSTVELVICKLTKRAFACKIIDKMRCPLSRIKNEISILRSLEHRNITRLHEAYETKDNAFLILDQAQGGELYERLLKKKRCSEAETRRVVYSLLRTCSYLHSKNVVHRDIKLENILLEDSQSSHSNILVCDFGLAKVLEEEPEHGERRKRKHKLDRASAFRCGSDYYVSPEILAGDGETASRVSEILRRYAGYKDGVDIWSVGVCMYILLSGSAPFGNDDEKIEPKTRNWEYDLESGVWKKVSSEAKDLLKRLLTVDPERRITAEEALKHLWFDALHVSSGKPPK